MLSLYRAGWLVALLLSFVPLQHAAGQQRGDGVLFGRVTGDGGQPVAGALVTATESESGARSRALSDASGNYRLAAVATGRYRVTASHLGFAAGDREVALSAGSSVRLDFELQIAALEIEGIDVQARRDAQRERARFENEAGVTARVVGGEELKLLPGLAEADVLRAIEVLPGVISTSDFSSAFNVRGGSADQNLILLDGFPIFNPFHLGGLFSVFNSDALARAELFAGGFGAQYGGRVSSVLNIETKDDTPEGLEGAAGVSLLATRLMLRNSLPLSASGLLGGSGAGTWMISARRSYFDQLLAPVVDFPYHLTDLQAHLSLPTAGGGTLRLTAYGGGDVLDLSDFNPPGAEEDDESILRLRWNWGNTMAGAHLRQPLGEWLLDGRAGYTQFSERLSFPDFADTRFGSGISQGFARADLRREVSPALSFVTGAELSRISYDNFAEAGGTSFDQSADTGTLLSGWGSMQWRPGDAWIVEPGLRLDRWAGSTTVSTTLSPRFAVKRFLGDERDAALKLSVGRYTQFLHSLRNEEFPLSNDVWVLADENVPAVISDQIQLGIEKYWGEDWYASAEVYGRNFRGVTEFNFGDDPNDPADDLLGGTGRSYGLDLLVRRSAGGLTGWATLSLLRATRTLPDPLALGFDDLAPEVTFAPIWDRRADLDVVLSYSLPWQVEAGARWNIGSPIPYTRPISQYAGWEYDYTRGEYRLQTGGPGSDGDPPVYVVPGARNAQRYPAYQRLDATLRRSFSPRWGTVTPYLQLLNVYNQKNVLFYFYNYNQLPPTRSGFTMFPLLPTIGVDVNF